ncbi:AraC family transcriptional regulator [Paenibacillus agaridevorans]|uniref:AraC family transcriptional regulator n=1 Tax=Paenibacillus agaridevorans TaxID=171404 RepID=A0A2R5EQN5_9BACL|nr:helix-turn-helix domain-containing protein [Paenibacillus agaridevorans]GBG07979.1 AraC family transcriptional regulator [Paenibacillus agaridevorans]
MHIIRTMANRKYLQRIFFYVNLSMAGLLVIAAVSFYLYSQQIILQTQKDSSRKVLAQIKHNITYITDIVRNIGITASMDPNIVYLMNAAVPEPVMKFQTIRKMDTLADSTSFIDSIVVVNGAERKFYSGGSGAWSRTNWTELQERLTKQLESMGRYADAKLIPFKLDESSPDVDLFSFILTENHAGSGQLPNAVIVNIRPQWIFDNIKSLDNVTDNSDGMVLLDEQGKLLQTEGIGSPYAADLQRLLERMVHSAGNSTHDFSIQKIEGRKYVISEMKMDVSELKVMNILPYEKVMGKAETLRDITLALIVVFLVASFILSLVITSRLYRPIGKLFELFHRNDVRTDESESGSHDEMSFISDVYRLTLDKLRQANREESGKKQIVSDYYLRRWLTDSRSMTGEELHHCAEASPGLFEAGGDGATVWQLAVLSLEQPITDKKTPESVTQEKLYRFAACNIVEETVARHYSNRVVDMNNEYIVVIIRVMEGEADQPALTQLLAEARRIFKQFYRQRTFSAAVSDAVEDYKDLTQVYEWTVQQLLYRLALGPETIITPDDVRGNMERSDFTLPAELERKLADSIRTKDADAIDKHLSRVFELIASIHYDYMTYAAIQVVLLVKAIMREPAFASYANSVELQNMNQKVIKAESLTAMREIIGHFLQQLCEEDPSHLKEDRNLIIVDTIKEFIENNYSDINLSLQSIAAYLKMSPAYVGRIFKQYEGGSVGDYLNGYRLDKACELLIGSSYNVKEIADCLGFNNASYFITLFKKKYGVTPKEYRLNAALGK